MFDITLKEIILTLFSGLGAALIAREVYKRKSVNKVTQKNNDVKGDMAGRDINK